MLQGEHQEYQCYLMMDAQLFQLSNHRVGMGSLIVSCPRKNSIFSRETSLLRSNWVGDFSNGVFRTIPRTASTINGTIAKDEIVFFRLLRAHGIAVSTHLPQAVHFSF
jgi:hypothetical protein